MTAPLDKPRTVTRVEPLIEQPTPWSILSSNPRGLAAGLLLACVFVVIALGVLALGAK